MSLTFSCLRDKQRWGFVVYRTDYSSNENWTKFNIILDTWTRSVIENKGPEEASLLDAWQQMWYFDDASEFDKASIDQLRKHYHSSWFTSLSSEEQQDTSWPEHQLFPVADKEVLDNVRPFHIELAKNPQGEYPFVKAFDKDAPNLDDEYPAWMRVKIPSIFYLYETPLHLETNSMRSLRSRNTDWFDRDDCYYLEDTFADVEDSE